MARIAGVTIPKDKAVVVALTYIKGIGRSLSEKILAQAEIPQEKKASELSDEELSKIQKLVGRHPTGGELERMVRLNIKRLKDIECYRGRRHKKGLPVRGQKTRKNARTWKGPRPSRVNVGR